MFGWLKRGAASHPLADLRATQELVAALPANDAERALERIGRRLDSITKAREIEPEQRWEVVDLLDQAAVAHRRKLERDYLSGVRLHKGDERPLRQAALEFWKAAAAAFGCCIAQLDTAPRTARVAKEVLARIAVRSLHAAGRQLTWIYLRHGHPEESVWRDLGRAYRFAENRDVAAARTELYVGGREVSSPQEELLKALMLAMASPDNLAAQQAYLAERVAAHFAGCFVLAEKSEPTCPHAFDLASPKPPVRVHAGRVAGPTVRYFGPGDAGRGIADLMEQVRIRNGVPGDLNLGGQFDTAVVLAVLAHVARVWNTAPPTRGAERVPIAIRITVVPGLSNILRCLELAAGGASSDLNKPVEQETWPVFDTSDGGYGAIVPEDRGTFDFDPVTGVRHASGDWLRIGSLIAVREDGATNWRIGRVRRLTFDTANRHCVGIGLIDGLAALVRLAPANQPRAVGSERRRSAVLMTRELEAGAEVLVVMRAGYFAATQRFAMHYEGRDFVLEPGALIEGDEDFDCASFTITSAAD